MNPDDIYDYKYGLGQKQNFDLEYRLDLEAMQKLMDSIGGWHGETRTKERQQKEKQERMVPLVAKMGKNFVPDLGDNNIIGHWKSEPKTPNYRRRWVGGKYIWETVEE